MGCDIHVYTEYGTGSYWTSLAKYDCNRDYYFFGKLAGVRGGKALIEPKGIPKDVGITAKYDYLLFVTKKESANNEEKSCTLEQAERWVREGSSKWWIERKRTKDWVTNPDYHSMSWLTSGELARVFDACRNEDESVSPVWQSIFVSLKEMEKAGDKSRVVFWFDN